MKLLENRLRSDSSLKGRDVNTASRTTTTHLSAPTHSEHGPPPPHTTLQPTPSHSTSTQPRPPLSLPTTTTTNIIQKFLTEAATIAHPTPHTRHSHDTSTPPHSHEYATTQQHSGDFFPLQPVHGRDDAPKPRVTDSTMGGEVMESGVGREGEGVAVDKWVEEEGGVSQLEDVFSKTLDNIVDRHFQQLDSSLKKLMNKRT